MKVTREKTEVLLMEYAAGALDEACALLAATYVALCPEARRYYRRCEQIGGILMEYDCRPVRMHQDSLQHVLDRLDTAGSETPEPASAAPDRHDAPFPAPLQQHLDREPRAPRWKRFGQGMQYMVLNTMAGEYSAQLVRMAPGAKAPRHSHPGIEMTLVLEGGFSDEYGHYQAGDLVIADDGIEHTPVADEPEGCLCFAVTDRPVHFSSGLYRLLNLLTR